MTMPYLSNLSALEAWAVIPSHCKVVGPEEVFPSVYSVWWRRRVAMTEALLNRTKKVFGILVTNRAVC